MTRTLVVTHSPTETLGSLEGWLVAEGHVLQVLQPWAGDAVPSWDAAGQDALVVLGGPQQAYDDSSAPWLAATKELLRGAVAAGAGVLGVCLGHQLLAEALGGEVAPMGVPELGARLVAKRDVADDDPVLGPAPLTPVVVQWHSDEVTRLPAGAVLLASSPRCAVQAFRVGSRAYGVQGHPEAREEHVRAWAARADDELAAAGLDREAVLARTLDALPEVAQVWEGVVRRWARLAADPAGGAPPHRLLPVV